MLIGLSGVGSAAGIQVWPHMACKATPGTVFLLLQLASAVPGRWVSILQKRRQVLGLIPSLKAGVQQLVAGLAYVLPAVFISSHHIQWSPRGTARTPFNLVVFWIAGWLHRIPLRIEPSADRHCLALYIHQSGWVAADPRLCVFIASHSGGWRSRRMAIIFSGASPLWKRFAP